jgi:hypothetical protein
MSGRLKGRLARSRQNIKRTASSGSLTTHGLRSSVTGTRSFFFALPLKEGDVPLGTDILADTPGFQAVIPNRWPDGSAKVALCAGSWSATANTTDTFTLSKGTATSGSNLTEAQLAALEPNVTVQFGSYGTVTLMDLIGETAAVATAGNRPTGGLVRTRFSGPECSEFHYYSPVGSDNHLACWFHVRLFKNNQIWLNIIPEHGWFRVTNPGRKSFVLTINVNGTQVFNDQMVNEERARYASATHFQVDQNQTGIFVPGVRVRPANATNIVGTVVSRIYYESTSDPYLGRRNSTIVEVAWDTSSTPTDMTTIQQLGFDHHQRYCFSYWYDDPTAEILPFHNLTYIQSTKQLPYYKIPTATSPDASVLNALPQSSAFSIPKVNWPDNMGDGGFSPTIGMITNHEALYLVTGDIRPLRCTILASRAHGRYFMHYRDETTFKPVRTTQYGQYGIAEAYSGIAGTTGPGSATLKTPTPTNTYSTVYSHIWDRPHCPNPAYLAFLLTGDFYFLEEEQFTASIGIMSQSENSRGGASCIMGFTVRSLAWQWRNVACAASITPDSDTDMRTEFITIIGNSAKNRYDTYVAPTGTHYNTLGITALYPVGYQSGDGVYHDAPWQHDFVAMALGLTKDLKLEIATVKDQTHADAFEALVMHCHKCVVGRLGTSGETNFCFRNAAHSVMGLGTPETLPPSAWYTNWGQVYSFDFGTNNNCADGSALLEYTDNSTTFSQSHWGDLQGAIAYAVDHEVPGALEGFNRMIGASNWATLSNQFRNNVVKAIWPRTV